MSENDENVENINKEVEVEDTEVVQDNENQTEATVVDADVIVEDEDEEIEKLKSELADLKTSHDEMRNKYLRAIADKDNFRKRARKDVAEARENGKKMVLEDMLPALDSIDLALKSATPTEENKAVYDGMIMVQKQFMASMAKFELKEVEAVGQSFDPAMHEAVSSVPSPDHPAGAVIDELRKGYFLGERLIRAAMVVVSAGSPANESTDDAPADAADDNSAEAAAQDDAPEITSGTTE